MFLRLIMWNNHLTLPQYINLLDKYFKFKIHNFVKLKTAFMSSTTLYQRTSFSTHLCTIINPLCHCLCHIPCTRDKFAIQLWTDATNLEEPTIRLYKTEESLERKVMIISWSYQYKYPDMMIRVLSGQLSCYHDHGFIMTVTEDN